MKTDDQLSPPWERQFYGKSKFTVTDLRTDKAEIQKAAKANLRKRTVRVKSTLP